MRERAFAPVEALLLAFVLSALARPVSCAVFLEERFDGPVEWEDHTGSTFAFAVENGVGHISERGGGIGDHYISQVVNISGAVGPHLELDYRASAATWSYTQGRVDIVDPDTGKVTHFPLSEKKVVCFSWRHAVLDISDAAQGKDLIEVRINLRDPWQENEKENFWFDNIVLWGMPHVSGIPDIELESGQTSRPIDLDQFVTEDLVDKSQISWQITGNENVFFRIDPRTHEAFFYAASGWTGTEQVTITARTPDGREGSQVVNIRVVRPSGLDIPPTHTSYLEDDLNGQLDWENHVSPGYSLEHANGYVKIRERSGHGGFAYLSRKVNIFGARSVHLEMDYMVRACCPMYAIGRIELVDPHTHRRLGVLDLGQSPGTGFKHGVFDITDMVGNMSVVELRIGIWDPWYDSYDERILFDNVMVWGTPHISGVPDIEFDRDSTSDPIYLDQYVVAENTTQLLWSVTGGNHVHIRVDPETHEAIFSADPKWYGDEEVAVLVRDPEGQVGCQKIQVTVRPLKVPVTIDTSPRVSAVSADGKTVELQGRPAQFTWTEGTSHTVSVANPVTADTTRYVFQNWSDGCTSRQRTVKAAEGLHLTANFRTEYKLSVGTSPKGIASLEESWHPSGSVVSLQPPTLQRYEFDHWMVDGQKVSSPAINLSMDRPHVATACFRQVLFDISISSSPRVATLTVDGSEIAPSSQPAVCTWREGSRHNLSAPAKLQEPGSIYLFTRWSDGSTSRKRSYSPTADGSLVAFYWAKHFLEVVTDPPEAGGIILRGWHDSNDHISLQPRSIPGFQFLGWEIDGVPAGGGSITVSTNKPMHIVALYLQTIPSIQAAGRVQTKQAYQISWDQLDKAEVYQLQEATDPDFSSARTVYQGSETWASMVHTKEATYYYRVRARIDGAWQGWSHRVTVEVDSTPVFLHDEASIGLLLIIAAAVGLAVWIIAVCRTEEETRDKTEQQTREKTEQQTKTATNKRRRLLLLSTAVCLILLFVLAIHPYGIFGTTRWVEVAIEKNGSEAVWVPHFGTFLVQSTHDPFLGDQIVVSSPTLGEGKILHPVSMDYYDGVVKGRVLVFEWSDSDIDYDYVRYIVMSRTRFERYQREMAKKLKSRVASMFA